MIDDQLTYLKASFYNGDFPELFPILILPKIDLSTKKQCCKQGTVWPSGTSYLEMILALLAEVVAIYV